jgi:hypothetical protein
MLAQFGFSEPGFKATVFPLGHLAVHQKPDSFLEVELIDIGGLHLLFKGAAHSEEAQGL